MVLRYVEAVTKAHVADVGDSDVDSAVKNYFADHRVLHEDDATAALHVHDTMKGHNYWLACDCEPADGTVPFLHAARPAQLRRSPAPNPDHHPDCRFVNRTYADGTDVEPSRVKNDEDLAVHDEFAVPGVGRGSGGSGHTAYRRLPGISRVLFKALAAAKVNKLAHGADIEAPGVATRVWDQSYQLTLCGAGAERVSLKSMLVTADSANQRTGIGRISDLKERVRGYQGTWPSGSRPHGFMIGMMSGFQWDADHERFNLQMVGWSNPQFIQTRPNVFAEQADRLTRQPYIGVVSYALPARQANVPFGMRCFLQPCFSPESWFPVDSNFERETVRTTIEWRDQLPDGWTVDIEKPLFDELVPMPNGDNVPCRPDFILTVKRGGTFVRTIAVETMGIIGVEYEIRKRRTHPAMLKRWKWLVQHDMTHRRRFDIEKARQLFLEQLTEAALNGTQPYYQSVDR